MTERARTLAEEVAWGEGEEERILRRWVGKSAVAGTAQRVVKSNDYDDYDFFLLDRQGCPVCYVEVKLRRTPFGKYGDAICPVRKHEFAKRLQQHAIPFVMVTEYGDGVLVEVDLTEKPAQVKGIKRRDRAGAPIPHAFYSKQQLTVLEGPS